MHKTQNPKPVNLHTRTRTWNQPKTLVLIFRKKNQKTQSPELLIWKPTPKKGSPGNMISTFIISVFIIVFIYHIDDFNIVFTKNQLYLRASSPRKRWWTAFFAGCGGWQLNAQESKFGMMRSQHSREATEFTSQPKWEILMASRDRLLKP